MNVDSAATSAHDNILLIVCLDMLRVRHLEQSLWDQCYGKIRGRGRQLKWKVSGGVHVSYIALHLTNLGITTLPPSSNLYYRPDSGHIDTMRDHKRTNTVETPALGSIGI